MARILFVCTGNICRSPTAEAVARSQLGHLIEFASAGLHGLEGSPASDNAVAAAAEIGIDLSRHVGAVLTLETAGRADRIYVMTDQQRRQLVAFDPGLAARIELLDPSGEDVVDPYGRTMEVYRRSRDHISAAIAGRLDEWRKLAGDG